MGGDHTGPRALTQDKRTQTERQLDERGTEQPPCLADLPHPSFIESQIPHQQHHDRDINSQASRRARGSLYLFSAATKEKPGFCFVYTRRVKPQ